MDEGVAVLPVGGRVHDDAAGQPACAVDAQIAAEAGIGTGQDHGVGQQLVGRSHLPEPAGKVLGTGGIGPGDGGDRRHGETS